MKNRMLQEYKARLAFWWATRSLKDGKDFDLSFDELGLIVTILRGKFKDVQFRFANIMVREDDDGLIDFSTVVVYNPLDADVTHPKFGAMVSNILRLLLRDAMGEHKLTASNRVKNEDRNIDTGESTQEREFHEESTPLLEKRVSKRKPRKKSVPADSGIHTEIQQPTKPKRARARTTGKKGSNRK